MSWATDDVPPNNSKEESEFFGDSWICDDWVDYDLDVTKEDNSSLNTSESAADEIPPKTDTSSSKVSTFQSPKNKKRKLASFDDLLENLDFNILYINFTKLLQFLQSNTKEMCFPFTLKEYEEFFKMIVQDMSILRSRSLDANYRGICYSIIDAASFDRTGFLLTYMYEYRKGFEKKVLVIKKIMNKPIEEETSLSSSSESLKSSFQSSSQADPNEILRRSTSAATISTGFKIHCLRTTLAFIKNDVIKIKEFPELSTEQAQFMHSLLESVTTFPDFGNHLDIIQLYRALWEAVKIYSLKYEFRIRSVESWGGKKNLVLEKIPKGKPAETAVNSSAVNSNQIMNPKAEFSKPAVPELIEKPKAITKKMLKKQLRMENKVLFIKRMPTAFVLDALNSIVEFLSDDGRDKMVLAPKNHDELLFYRKCIEWCRTSVAESLCGSEYERLHDQIAELLTRMKCKVPKAHSNKINVNTGIKEVTYIKKPKFEPPAEGSAQRRVNKRKHSINSDLSMDRSNSVDKSISKKKKMNLQSILNSPGIADNTIIININQSLRNKKKNKKLKNVNSNKSKDTLSNKAARQVTRWSEESDSETCSDRGDSVDRKNVGAKAVTKRDLNKTNQSVNASLAGREKYRWRDTAKRRKEQLIEALSVPVQSDKAMKMMRGMGWSGGALGARGNGITIPIMPALTLPSGAGLGHERISLLEIPNKLNAPQTGPCWISKNSNTQKETLGSESDIIDERTKQSLLENPSYNTSIKSMELPKPTNPNVELLEPTNPNVELPEPTNPNVELPEPTNSITRLPITCNFRQEILQCVLELLKTDATIKILNYDRRLSKKDRKFVTNAMTALKSRGNNSIFCREEYDIANKIRAIYKELPQFVLKAFISYNAGDVEIRKLPTEFKPPVMIQHEGSNLSPKPIHAIITEENINSYIEASGTACESKKAFDGLKFRVLFLLNVLNFVKSFNEELEVTFNKVVPQKQQLFIEKSIEEVNKRIKFGSTPAEIKLSVEIKNHINGAFLGVMFNHQYTSATLNKYFRFKRLNRPDNAVKRKSQATVDLDNFTSESLNETKTYTDERTDKENNYAPDYNNSADNDSDVIDRGTSTEEYNNNNIATGKDSNLPPEESSVNLSTFLCLYNKEKRNKPSGNKYNFTNNNNKVPAFKNKTNETDNRNSKNNIGNGNVDIDNNDNQVIDMKKVDSNTKITTNDTEMVAEYVMCLDYTEEVIDCDDISINNFNNEAVNFSENDQPIKHGKIVVANNEHVETMHQHEKNLEKKLRSHEIDAMMNEVLLNTEDLVDPDVMINDDSVSNDNCTKINIVKGEIQNIFENSSKNDKDVKKEETDVTMISINEPMEVISIREESIKVEKDDSSEVNVEVARKEDENSIKPNNNVIVKEETNLEIKTDCDIISKENIGLSEDNCDNQSVEVSHLERVGTEKDVPNILNKRESEIRNVYIVHVNNPIGKITQEKAKEIQKIISSNIMQTKELPLLMCHGVLNGALIYTCHNKKSFDWLKNTIGSAGDFRVISTRDVTKMALKFNCFFDFDTDYLFRMIELYNQGLSTKEWVVERTKIHDGYATFVVRMDKFSVNYIHAADLALFAGVDKVEFSLIWE